jgi:hypothetical protein
VLRYIKHSDTVTELSVTRPVSRMPCAMISPAALDLDGIDFAKFGITAIRVMSGADVVRERVTR